jgi:hypothetical protein
MIKFSALLLFCALLFSHSSHAESTNLDWNQLIFSRGGGFEDTGSYIRTLNSKGLSTEGDFISRSTQKETTDVYVRDSLVINNPDGSTTSDWHVLIGNALSKFIVMNHDTISALASENYGTVDAGLNPTTLYIQEQEGPVWIGNHGGGVNNAIISVVPILQGDTIIHRVGIGTTQPSAALHVAGNLFLDGTIADGEIASTFEGHAAAGSIARDAPANQWHHFKTIPFRIEWTRHGVLVLANATMRNHSVNYPNGTAINRTGSAKFEIVNSSGTVIAESNTARFHNEWHSNAHATYTMSSGAELDPGDYTIKLYSQHTQFLRGAGTDGTNGYFTTDGLAYAHVIALPIDEVGDTLVPPDIPSIGREDVVPIVLTSEEGNYITKDKVAFNNGGRIFADPSALNFVDKYGTYYPVSFPRVSAKDIWVKNILSITYPSDTDGYEFYIPGEAPDDDKSLVFGENRLREDDVTATDYAERNIQTLGVGLTFPTEVNFSQGGLTIKDYVGVNLDSEQVSGTDTLLEVNGDIIVENTVRGSLIVSDEKIFTPAEGSGTYTVHTETFTLPGDLTYDVYLFYNLSAYFDDYSSPHKHMIEFNLEVNGEEIDEGKGMSWYGFESDQNFQNDGASFMGFGKTEQVGGSTFTVAIKHIGTTIHDAPSTISYTRKTTKYHNNEGRLIILAIPN